MFNRLPPEAPCYAGETERRIYDDANAMLSDSDNGEFLEMLTEALYEIGHAGGPPRCPADMPGVKELEQARRRRLEWAEKLQLALTVKDYLTAGTMLHEAARRYCWRVSEDHVNATL